MSSYNRRNNNKNKDTGFWIGVIVCFCLGLWPVSVVMLIIRALSRYDDKKTQNAKNRWEKNINQMGRDVRRFADDFRSDVTDFASEFYRTDDRQDNSGSTYHYTYQNGQRIDPDRQSWQLQQQQLEQDRARVRQQQEEQRESARRNAARQQEQAEKQKRFRLFKKYGDTGRWSGLFTGGAVFAGMGVVATFACVVENLWELTAGNYRWFLEDIYGGLVVIGIGAVLCYLASKKKKIARRNRQYFSVIGDDNYVELSRLAAVTGTDVDTMCDDISRLLDKGAFGDEAYLDMSRMVLILNRKGEDEIELREAQMRAEKPKHERPENDLLRQIREVNDRIPDERLTKQIYRIEEITGQILQCQEDHPEKASQLHSFLSYYLPTTLKILNAYAEMEEQAVQGKNITETKARIESMMDKVVAGFEEQLDQLYAGDRMDIATEISAMETMMAQDGLTDDSPFSTSSGGGMTMGGL